jgi:hypothetical protein
MVLLEEVVGNIRLFSLFTPLRCLPSPLFSLHALSRVETDAEQKKGGEERLMVRKKILLESNDCQSAELEPTRRDGGVRFSIREKTRKEEKLTAVFTSPLSEEGVLSSLSFHSLQLLSFETHFSRIFCRQYV